MFDWLVKFCSFFFKDDLKTPPRTGKIKKDCYPEFEWYCMNVIIRVCVMSLFQYIYYVQSSATSARLLAKNDVQSWELLCYTLIISISIVGTFDSTQNLFHFLIFDYHSFSIRLLFAYKIPCLLIGYLVLTDDTLQISISTIQRIIQKNVESIQIQKDATYDFWFYFLK